MKNKDIKFKLGDMVKLREIYFDDIFDELFFELQFMTDPNVGIIVKIEDSKKDYGIIRLYKILFGGKIRFLHEAVLEEFYEKI